MSISARVGSGPAPLLMEDPILFARKNDEPLRMSIPYMALKEQVRPDKYLLTRIDDLLD